MRLSYQYSVLYTPCSYENLSVEVSKTCCLFVLKLNGHINNKRIDKHIYLGMNQFSSNSKVIKPISQEGDTSQMQFRRLWDCDEVLDDFTCHPSNDVSPLLMLSLLHVSRKTTKQYS